MAYKEHINEAVALLRKLISTPSVSRDETEAADILHDFMTDKGLSPTRVSNNVWAQSSRWNDDWPTILLNAHIDTVKPVAAWTRDPYTPTLLLLRGTRFMVWAAMTAEAALSLSWRLSS